MHSDYTAATARFRERMTRRVVTPWQHGDEIAAQIARQNLNNKITLFRTIH